MLLAACFWITNRGSLPPRFRPPRGSGDPRKSRFLRYVSSEPFAGIRLLLPLFERDSGPAELLGHAEVIEFEDAGHAVGDGVDGRRFALRLNCPHEFLLEGLAQLLLAEAEQPVVRFLVHRETPRGAGPRANPSAETAKARSRSR